VHVELKEENKLANAMAGGTGNKNEIIILDGQSKKNK